ncbi:MAG: GNAT family N-acetyltransferase [Deltaproteobacteria bacterium]|nr:GNAT family N-acetyltransferase [Deltaproteobacteria bacterium]
MRRAHEVTDSMAIIRPVRAEDEAGILRLFSTVFHSDMSPEVWRWKYLRDEYPIPAFVAEEDGEIVCHYGTIRQRIAWQGQEHAAWDAIDVMAHPHKQGRGLFRHTIQAFMREVCEGYGLFLYGFPTERHKRLGELLVGYEPVARVHKVSTLLPDTPAKAMLMDVVYDVLPLNWDAHWPLMQDRFGMLTLRDRAYLAWRYLARPNRRYRLVTIPAMPALAIVGVRDGVARLMEFLVPSEDKRLARQVLRGAECVAREEGAASLEGWFPTFSWECQFLCSDAQYRAEDTEHWLECRIFDQRVSAGWLRGNFYYSFGDFDVY